MVGMNDYAENTEAAEGDPAQQLLDALRAEGPTALAELLGDQGFLLVELATEPGGLFSPAPGSSGQYSAVIRRLQEQRSAMDALETRCMVALADALRDEDRAAAQADAAYELEAVEPEEDTDRRADRAAARDVSMSTRRSPDLASRTLASARRLVESMPTMLRALATGLLSESAVRAMAASVAPLAPAQREQVDALLGTRLAALDGCGTEEWKGAVAAAIAASDAEGESRRHEHARGTRSVTVRRGEHGMAVVSARLPALDAMKIRKRLSLEAERLRASGDRRGHQQIQADSFIASLLGAEDGMDRTDLDIGVIITDRALLHPGQGELAHVEGYGPVPVEALRHELSGPLRELAQDRAPAVPTGGPGTQNAAAGPTDLDPVAVETRGLDDAFGADAPAVRLALRRLYTHPTTGELVAVDSVAREFPRALARFIRWRDVTCRGPFCNAPIRHSDHIRPYAAGGHTCLDNGQGLCAFCNDKEQQTTSVELSTESPGHQVTWTSRGGTVRTTGPTALTGPRIEPPPELTSSSDTPPPQEEQAQRDVEGNLGEGSGPSSTDGTDYTDGTVDRPD
ncbi:HNH endonuclease [Brachybacterium tyrofermentans]